MITLPVSSSVYQSMVANIQQIHTNGDGTLCITPMQVQKSGHQHSISHLNSTSISGSLLGNNCSGAPCISSVNSSFSNVNSAGSPLLANCNAAPSSPFGASTEMSPSLNCENGSNNNNNNNNTNSNLLELCRVLSQSTGVSGGVCPNTLSFNNLSTNFATNDRKPTKNKKIVNRNQFFNIGTSSTFSNDSNGMERNFMEPNIDDNKLAHESDTNNNSNNNHSEESNGNMNHDLKCAQILVSTVTDQDSAESMKTDNIPIAIQFNENESRHVKMECEIDAS